jgi:hypothetical protein
MLGGLLLLLLSGYSLSLTEFDMKKIIVAIALALSATVVYANCVTNTTFTRNGIVTCTVCCYSGNCTTTCF